MSETENIDKIKAAIAHYEYGIRCDIFREPVLTYAKTAVTALRVWLNILDGGER